MKTANILKKHPVIIGFVILLTVSSQSSFLYSQTYNAVQSEVKVTGKSNVRDWELKSQTAKSAADFELNGKSLERVKSITFSVAVKDLKGHASLMTKRAHKALKAYPYKNIIYTGKVFNVSKSGDEKYLIKTEGNLNIAGITRIMALPVIAVLNNDGTITCTGNTNIKMSDFKVRLPKVLVEEMDIENTVNVSFKLVFDKP